MTRLPSISFFLSLCILLQSPRWMDLL